jgi:hypothetical protein
MWRVMSLTKFWRDCALGELMDFDPAWLPWLLLLIPAYYLGMPLAIWPFQIFPGHPRLVELDTRHLGSELTHFLKTRMVDLFELGFTEPTTVRMPNSAPLVSNYLVLMVNRKTGDKAMVTAIVGGGPVPDRALYVEFSTRFETGEVFNTHNCAILGAFPPAPKTVRTQVPSVIDVKELYEVHQFVMSKRAVRAEKVLYEPGQALEYLIRYAFLKIYDDQVKRGWFAYDANSDYYRPTLQGAYLIAWGLMQPFKAIRTMAMHWRAARILREFDLACR